MVRKSLIIYILITLVIATGFCLYRSSVGFVWDDSPHLTANLYDVHTPVLFEQKGILKKIAIESFGKVTKSGYRPMSAFINLLGVSLFSNLGNSPIFWFFAVGIILGSSCVTAYFVSRRYLKTKLGAILAIFLFTCSAPVVTASWIVFAGIQVLVPLFICVGLLLYWKIVESEKPNFFLLIILYILLLTGPWFREFIGFLPLLIIFLEIRRARRPTILMAVLFLLFLHALFPTFLIKFLFFEDLPFKSILSMGSLSNQIASSTNSNILFFVKNLFSLVRWQVPSHFLTLFPPIIIGFVLIDYILLGSRGSYVLITRRVKIGSLFASETSLQDWVTIFKNVYLPFCFTVVFILGVTKFYKPRLFYLLLCLTFFLQGLRKDSFLAIWFLLFYIPFLWVFTEQVHLAYSLLPASIILTSILEDVFLKLEQNIKINRLISYPLYFALMIGIADQGLNIYSCYKVVNEIFDGICSVSKYVKSYIPRSSIIVTNVMHMDDIRLYTGNWVRIFYTVRAGIPRSEDGITSDPNALEQLLKENYGKRDVYFIDADFDYTPDKVNYHSHRYVRNKSVAMEDLGIIHTTQVQYPFLEPSKAYIPRPFISFLGPPDLENDFYRGPAQDGTPFMREVYCEYHLYRVTGTHICQQ